MTNKNNGVPFEMMRDTSRLPVNEDYDGAWHEFQARAGEDRDLFLQEEEEEEENLEDD